MLSTEPACNVQLFSAAAQQAVHLATLTNDIGQLPPAIYWVIRASLEFATSYVSEGFLVIRLCLQRHVVKCVAR
jgi:hypothetical protein